MEFCIKLEKDSDYRIIIETPMELGEQMLSLLLKEDYTLIETPPQAIGRSESSAFVLDNPDMKYYSLMVLAQRRETDLKDIANCIHANFGGYLTYHGEKYQISSEIDDFASY